MTSFNRPGAGLHVKVIRLPPAYGNVLAFSLLFNLLVKNNKKALWIRFQSQNLKALDVSQIFFLNMKPVLLASTELLLKGFTFLE